MRLTGQRNQCPTCGKYFSRTSGFVKHRIGPFGDGPLGTSPKRRCMTDEEMRKYGFHDMQTGIFRLQGPRSVPDTWKSAQPVLGTTVPVETI
jgi:hypothetical protein